MAVLLCTLPQILYLVTRNATLGFDSGVLTLHADRFLSGSGGGNCGAFPGNAACQTLGPQNPYGQPALLGVLWTVLLATFLGFYRREHRARQVYFMAAWLCLALSAMGKGAPGIVIPLFVIAVFLGATYRWRELLELNPIALLLIFACLALPWYVQMLMRHGAPFSDRLLIHDMYKRAFDHVHDTNVGVDTSIRYYLWQLGYGLFPWSGVAGAGLLYWLGRADDEAGSSLTPRQASTFFGLWFIGTFSLFTVSGTKFHHYVLPAVPPLAVLSAVLVDAMLGGVFRARKPRAYLLSMACSAVFALAGLGALWGGSLLGASELPGPGVRYTVGALSLLLSVYAYAVGTRFGGGGGAPQMETATKPRNDALHGLFGLGAAAGTLLVGLDFVQHVDPKLPGQLHLMQLFTYKYERPWPEGLDFRVPLLVFTAFFVIVLMALTFDSLRRHAWVMFGMGSILACAWGLNVYLFELAPHWGQRTNVIQYLQQRDSEDPPLVAYQMNWKGENFYTGNRLVTFVKTGDPFTQWLKKQRLKKVKTLYITTEPSRIDRLKRELGKFDRFTVLTSERDNNKFVVARVDF